jgi:hypothetical protein
MFHFLLLDTLRVKLHHLASFGRDVNLDGIATYFAVFDVGLLGHAQVKDKTDLLPAVGTKEKVLFGHQGRWVCRQN